jgi:hypothetical protein
MKCLSRPELRSCHQFEVVWVIFDLFARGFRARGGESNLHKPVILSATSPSLALCLGALIGIAKMWRRALIFRPSHVGTVASYTELGLAPL